MNKAKKIIPGVLLYLAGIILTATLSSCTMFDQSNNYLHIEDLVDHMVAQGVKIDQVQPIEPKLVGASRAFAVTIKGKEVGIYKYDISIKKQKDKVAKIAQTKEVYVLAIKFPAVVKGAFMLIGVERNPEKESIMAALDSFE